MTSSSSSSSGTRQKYDAVLLLSVCPFSTAGTIGLVHSTKENKRSIVMIRTAGHLPDRDLGGPGERRAQAGLSSRSSLGKTTFNNIHGSAGAVSSCVGCDSRAEQQQNSANGGASRFCWKSRCRGRHTSIGSAGKRAGGGTWNVGFLGE